MKKEHTANANDPGRDLDGVVGVGILLPLQLLGGTAGSLIKAEWPSFQNQCGMPVASKNVC